MDEYIRKSEKLAEIILLSADKKGNLDPEKADKLLKSSNMSEYDIGEIFFIGLLNNRGPERIKQNLEGMEKEQIMKGYEIFKSIYKDKESSAYKVYAEMFESVLNSK